MASIIDEAKTWSAGKCCSGTDTAEGRGARGFGLEPAVTAEIIAEQQEDSPDLFQESGSDLRADRGGAGDPRSRRSGELRTMSGARADPGGPRPGTRRISRVSSAPYRPIVEVDPSTAACRSERDSIGMRRSRTSRTVSGI